MKRYALFASVLLFAVLSAETGVSAPSQHQKRGVGAWPSGNALKALVWNGTQSMAATFKEEGFLGALSVVRNCYAHLKRMDWGMAQARCVSLDIAAYLHEYHQSANFRKLDEETDPYLSGHQFNARMTKYLPPPNGSFNEKNRYLTAIVHLCDDA